MNKLWMLAAILTLSGLLMTSCSNDDDSATEPTELVLQDGMWTGNGEGRSGTIIVKVTVENHQVTKVTVVNQSESSFAQETINNLCKSAVGRTKEMNVEVDGITGATPSSVATPTARREASMLQRRIFRKGAMLMASMTPVEVSSALRIASNCFTMTS